MRQTNGEHPRHPDCFAHRTACGFVTNMSLRERSFDAKLDVVSLWRGRYCLVRENDTEPHYRTK